MASMGDMGRMWISLPQDMLDELDAWGRARGLSRSQATQAAIWFAGITPHAQLPGDGRWRDKWLELAGADRVGPLPEKDRAALADLERLYEDHVIEIEEMEDRVRMWQDSASQSGNGWLDAENANGITHHGGTGWHKSH